MKSLRTKQILDMLARDGIVNTIALAEQFHVSIETIRRDFNYLEGIGAIKKIYGGAELKPKTIPDIPSFAARQNHMAATKAAMGERAAGYITNGSIVILDSGTTVLECTKRLAEKENMSYICSDVHSATELLTHGNTDVYILGGKLTPYGTTSGTFVREFLSSISDADFLLMSTEGVDFESGFSCDEMNINQIKQKCLKKTKTAIVLADHTKFNKRGFYKMCDFSDIDILITDSGTPSEILDEIRKSGVLVDVVECPDDDRVNSSHRHV